MTRTHTHTPLNRSKKELGEDESYKGIDAGHVSLQGLPVIHSQYVVCQMAVDEEVERVVL